jgi:hypothetical protein
VLFSSRPKAAEETLGTISSKISTELHRVALEGLSSLGPGAIVWTLKPVDGARTTGNT